MINQTYLAKNVSEYPLASLTEMHAFFMNMNRFRLGKQRRKYHVYIASPDGMGADGNLSETDRKSAKTYPMYHIYGIADVNDDKSMLFGRLIPKSLQYDVMVKNFMDKFGMPMQYAVTDDILLQTAVLMTSVHYDKLAITGAFIDDKMQCIFLTSVMPKEMSKQSLEEV